MARLLGILLTLAGLAGCVSMANARDRAGVMAQVQPGAPPASPPPAERRGREYLELMNRGRSAEIRAFSDRSLAPKILETLPAEKWPLVVGLDRYRMGVSQFVRFEPKGPTTGDLVFRSALLGTLQKIGVEVEAHPPHRILRLTGPDKMEDLSLPAPRSDGELAAQLDEYVRGLVTTRSFSGVVVLVRGNKPVFRGAYGHAEWRFKVPNTLETRFYTGSIGKSFTAVAIAQLVEQGRLSWEDPISRFLPDFPTPQAAKEIRIKHLLTHTSGLGTVYPEKIVPDEYRKVTDFLATAPRTAPVFKPGTAERYSNLGYLILGRIVEIASGEDYYDYVGRHVFRPAGMASAGTDPRDSVVERLAYGYEPDYSVDELAFQDNLLLLPARAAPFGGAYLTADDLLRFDRALRNGVLVKPETWQIMSTAKPELGAPQRGYGFKLGEGSRRIVGHGGNAVGTCTGWATITDTAEPYTFVILSNSGLESCQPLIERVYALLPVGPGEK